MSLIHAEWLKLSRRKLYPATLVAVAAFMALIAFVTTAFADIAPPEFGDAFSVPKPQAFGFGAQQVAGLTWLPLVLSVAVVGGEFSTTVWAHSLARNPSRLGHVVARMVVFTAASWLAFVFGMAVFSAIAAALGSGSGSPPLSEWIGYLWRFAAVALTWTALGLGAVAMTRSMVLGLVITLGFSFADGLVAVFVGNYEAFSLSAASTGLFDTGITGGPFAALIPGTGLSMPHALGIMAGWAAFGFVLTWWGLQRRDA
ncbi:MAG: hypothetical protein R3258_07140 [Acidimicrobiia bacterium]|nr:hypothetical protein [Acidimicrobiia bacterium]